MTIPDPQQRPWYYLSLSPSKTPSGPYLTLPLPRLVSATGTTAATAADNLIDGFGEPLQWTVVNGGSGARRYTSVMTKTSEGGMPGPEGDIGFRYSKEEGGWVRIDD